MTVKKLYKNLKKAFPHADFFLNVNGGRDQLLLNPSEALTEYKNCEVLELDRDESYEGDEICYILKIVI